MLELGILIGIIFVVGIFILNGIDNIIKKRNESKKK